MENIESLSVGVIMTIYKRDHYNHQLMALLQQTHLPSVIYVYQNESHINFNLNPDVLEKAKLLNIKINHIHSKDKNFKFHGRFTVPLIMKTDYVAIFDDDTIPGQNWLKNCLYTSTQLNCIVGANGRILPGEGYKEIGLDPNDKPNESPIEVDYVGHCWFFKRSWIHHMWRDEPASLENGEDIHLAASLKVFGGIKCYWAHQPLGRKDMWGDTQPTFGWDDHASYKKPAHGNQRSEIMSYWKEKGWLSCYEAKDGQVVKVR